MQYKCSNFVLFCLLGQSVFVILFHSNTNHAIITSQESAAIKSMHRPDGLGAIGRFCLHNFWQVSCQIILTNCRVPVPVG